MEFRKLELTLISAENLKEVNLFSKLNVYAVVSIANDPQFKRRVPPDHVGGRDPVWNYTVEFTVPAVSNPDPFLALHVLLRTERALGDRDVGEVTVPLKELLEGGRTDGGVRFVSYPVRMPHSKKTKGVLNMSYRLGEKVVKAAEVPVMAYPYPMPGSRARSTALRDSPGLCADWIRTLLVVKSPVYRNLFAAHDLERMTPT